ncbi:MAG: hypothetical protein CBC22_04735 [Alphaproteobacteria bacterium TMED62]|nr:MAG: hypothetical protein CBC22_04735 [Alphaproteobacteria bacterium TMED62]|tara:strand:- start:1377 stop:1928 length:552 start_codon:yes stop_codon:yes gene_type:complete
MAARDQINNIPDNNNNNFIQIPLIENLNIDGIEIVRQLGGFPNNWNPVMISMWLGNYDRMPLETHELNNGNWSIRTINQGLFQNINHVEAIIPLTAFNHDVIAFIHRILVNIDISGNNWGNWLRYVNNGGADRFAIAVRRYDPNVLDFVQDNYINNENENDVIHGLEDMTLVDRTIFGTNQQE